MNKHRISIFQTILVEGRYDKAALENMIDAAILPVHGFSVFTDKPLQSLIRKLAKENGIIVLMDSDAAGFKIRGFISGLVGAEQITHVYIPDIKGKEKRKTSPSKEGTLGVEGMKSQVIFDAFAKAGIFGEKPKNKEDIITKFHFTSLGLAGGLGSSEKRKKLYQYLELPVKMSTNSGIEVLNQMYTLEEFIGVLEKLKL